MQRLPALKALQAAKALFVAMLVVTDPTNEADITAAHPVVANRVGERLRARLVRRSAGGGLGGGGLGHVWPCVFDGCFLNADSAEPTQLIAYYCSFFWGGGTCILDKFSG